MPDKPYKFTDEVKNEYLRNLEDGMRRGEAARACGVTRQTVAAHRNDHPEFKKAEIEAELHANEIIEDALFERAKDGHVTAMIFWLCNRNPERWQHVNRVELSGPDGKAIETTDTRTLVLEVREALQNPEFVEKIHGNIPSRAEATVNGDASGVRSNGKQRSMDSGEPPNAPEQEAGSVGDGEDPAAHGDDAPETREE